MLVAGSIAVFTGVLVTAPLLGALGLSAPQQELPHEMLRGAASAAPAAIVHAASAARPFVWVADRDADRLFALDETLVAVGSVDAPCPARVRARSDGSAWCILPRTCGIDGRHDLAQARMGGALGRVLALDPVRDLECLAGEDALVVEGDWASANTRVLRVDASGAARQIAVWPELVAVAGAGDFVLVGTTGGDVLAFDAGVVGGAPLARTSVGGEVGDLAPAPDGGWWVLVVSGGGEVVRLGARLDVRWRAPLGGVVLDLAAVPGEERVWLPHDGAPWIDALGEGGVLEHEIDLARLGDVQRGDGAPGGGCVVAGTGFVLRIARDGAALVAQGGFDRVFDLSLTPP